MLNSKRDRVTQEQKTMKSKHIRLMRQTPEAECRRFLHRLKERNSVDSRPRFCPSIHNMQPPQTPSKKPPTKPSKKSSPRGAGWRLLENPTPSRKAIPTIFPSKPLADVNAFTTITQGSTAFAAPPRTTVKRRKSACPLKQKQKSAPFCATVLEVW